MVGGALTVDGRPWLPITNNLLAIAVSAAPILTVQLARRPSDMLAKFIPLFGKYLAVLLRAVASFCETLRTRREQTFLLTHGALTYACGDMVRPLPPCHHPSPRDCHRLHSTTCMYVKHDQIAQTAFAPAGAAAGRTLVWRPTQTAWAAAVGVISDTFLFYHWSLLLASIDEGPRRDALERRMPLIARRPGMLLPLKILVHLVTFQHVSTSLYLLGQGLVRGRGSMQSALQFMRSRYAAAIVPALGAFAIGGPLIYSLPVVAGAALRNLGVLAMCVYLAWVSSH
jgi:hypothetical protein